jgi:endonuclease V-like protein UPF0215 family
MEGATLVEAVAVGRFAVDGEDATTHLASWVAGFRFRAAIQGIVLGGITVAGLGIVDLEALSAAVAIPVFAVNRHQPDNRELLRALAAAGLSHREPILARIPKSYRMNDGLFLAHAGTTRVDAERMVAASLGKARLPEPLRVAHLIARAIVMGESRGRV